MGGPEINRIFECTEQTVKFCQANQDMELPIKDQAVFDKWEQMRTASLNSVE
jgi:hypothetical protein